VFPSRYNKWGWLGTPLGSACLVWLRVAPTSDATLKSDQQNVLSAFGRPTQLRIDCGERDS